MRSTIAHPTRVDSYVPKMSITRAIQLGKSQNKAHGCREDVESFKKVQKEWHVFLFKTYSIFDVKFKKS